MILTDTSFDRARDLIRLSLLVTKQMNNTSGGVWEKFYGNADGDADWVKPDDFDVFELSEIAARFDNSEAGAKYAKALGSATPGDVAPGAARKVMGAKLESDVLTSMHQAQVLRYTTRIRATAASVSRRRALNAADIANFYLTFIEKWGSSSDD